MTEKFIGYHSEWNMGSPGGWDYQRMSQDTGKLAWDRIKKYSGIDIELDYDAPILNPVPLFAQTLLRVHKINFGSNRPFIVLLAEKETLDKVGENIHFAEYLNTIPGVKAQLACPAQLELKGGRVRLAGHEVTVIFQDFNNDVIVKLRKKHNTDALLAAIKQGIVVNPRGTEPIGAKGVFEAVTDKYKDKMSNTTLERTPWTRLFYERRTKGARGEDIPDLVKWTEKNWEDILLKPVHGHSGKGIIIGFKEDNITGSIQHALSAGNYIVQKLVPPELWSEEFPWIDMEKKKIFFKKWQMDFRCFITDKGPIGFVTRFGSIPTNIGSGGGIQSTAILHSGISARDALKQINDVIMKLGFEIVSDIAEEINKRSLAIGNIYMLGPIMTTLRPRILTEEYIKQVCEYARGIWKDALLLESLWREGKLSEYILMGKEEEEISLLAPWRGSPALLASDGLFKFL